MDVLSEVEIARRIDPELRAGMTGTLTRHLPDGDLTVAQVRALDAALAIIPPPEGTVQTLHRPDGSGLELRRYVPSSPDPSRSHSVILWIHGGGMFLGSARQDDAVCQELCETLGVRIASVDYRLAPEHPYPEPLDDCYTALTHLVGCGDHVVVVGASAGGGLAAGLALLARDRRGPRITALQLRYPMLDDRITGGARRLANTSVWDARLNRVGWEAYLSGAEADAYAAPARAADLSGLPPTYLDTGELDLFFEEDTVFAERMRDAGGAIEFVVAPQAVHAFEILAPDAAISRRTVERRNAWLARALSDEGADS